MSAHLLLSAEHPASVHWVQEVGQSKPKNRCSNAGPGRKRGSTGRSFERTTGFEPRPSPWQGCCGRPPPFARVHPRRSQGHCSARRLRRTAANRAERRGWGSSSGPVLLADSAVLHHSPTAGTAGPLPRGPPRQSDPPLRVHLAVKMMAAVAKPARCHSVDPRGAAAARDQRSSLDRLLH